MKLLFTGDINFRGLEELDSQKCADILEDVMPYFEDADFRIVNLETPLADKEKHTPIKKSGPNLICAPRGVLLLETLHTDVCTLANNHIGDYGEGAVIDTLKNLSESGIRYCGAGENIKNAYDAVRLERMDSAFPSFLSARTSSEWQPQRVPVQQDIIQDGSLTKLWKKRKNPDLLS